RPARLPAGAGALAEDRARGGRSALAPVTRLSRHDGAAAAPRLGKPARGASQGPPGRSNASPAGAGASAGAILARTGGGRVAPVPAHTSDPSAAGALPATLDRGTHSSEVSSLTPVATTSPASAPIV